MEILEMFKTRRSVRGFKSDMPAQALLEKIAEAGTFAPTGRGKQSPKIIIVKNKTLRDKLSRLNAEVMGADYDPFYGAPVIAIVLADRTIPTFLYDGTLVIGNMLNMAHAVGLGACWIHRAEEVFNSPEGKDLLKQWGIEGDYQGIGHIALGYPKAELPSPQARKQDYITFVE